MTGLYIHVPYCVHKCGYCDFNSHSINKPEMELYITSLIQEMKFYSRHTKNQKISTVFLGGGTPTTLPVSLLNKILFNATVFFDIDPEAEVTLEANPATIKVGYLSKVREAGYNRISIGAQSFLATELKLLERNHEVDEISLTVQRARKSDFKNLSLDLMFGLPSQTEEQWIYSLKKALSLNPDHISAYNLTIEPKTRFHKKRQKGLLTLPDDEHQLGLFKKTIETLTSMGFEHYEISNFAKSGKLCEHNLNYWHNGDYLGLGAGASSFLKGLRYKNENKPADYISSIMKYGSAVTFSEQTNPATAMGETLMLGLRLREGVSIDSFEKRFDISFEKTYGPILKVLQENNLLKLKNRYVSLTENGLYLADSVIMEFMPES
tara:strand:+ start:743 stop:1879 length:1137 start_codon:yes stop_codon:yes gene_type:complete